MSEWIPVSERLPDESGEYLVYRYFGYSVAEYFPPCPPYQGDKWINEYGVRLYPLAWMPLPEPFQGNISGICENDHDEFECVDDDWHDLGTMTGLRR